MGEQVTEFANSDFPKLEVRDQLSWFPDAEVVACQECGRVFLVLPDMDDTLCPMCGKAPLKPQQSLVLSRPPELLLTPRLNNANLSQAFAGFISGVPYRTPDLTAENLTNRSRLVFWPMWLVDGDVKGEWQAMMGFDYQVKTARERLGSGGWSSTPELRTQTRFEPRRGSIERHYDNLAVPALLEHATIIEKLGSYNHQEAVNFTPDAINGAVVLMPNLDPQQLTGAAQVKLIAQAGAEAMRAAGAQSRQEFSLRGEYKNLNWTEYLLPIFSSHYADDDGREHTVYVQAQGGKVYGPRMASRRKAKTLSLILFGLGLLSLIAAMILMIVNNENVNFECSVAVLLMTFALMLIIGIAQLLRVKRWNSNQTSQFPPL